MKLIELLDVIDDGITVWISEDPNLTEGMYFGFVSDITLKKVTGYEVVTVYPEHYPAIYGFAGMSIIVKKRVHKLYW